MPDARCSKQRGLPSLSLTEWVYAVVPSPRESVDPAADKSAAPAPAPAAAPAAAAAAATRLSEYLCLQTLALALARAVRELVTSCLQADCLQVDCLQMESLSSVLVA